MTQTILHIDTSARHQDSITRDLTAQIVQHLGASQVIRRDLASPLPLLTEDWINANFTPADQRDEVQRDLLSLSDLLIKEIVDADTLVLGLPMYNFGAPASFKAWIDLIARAGVTFQYTSEGPQGLLENKRVIVAIATGGVPVGSDHDHLTGFLRQVMGFIGLTQLEFVSAEGIATDPEAALTAAKTAVTALAA